MLLLRCRRRMARSRNRRQAPRLSRKECSAGGMSAGPARPSLQRAGWLLQSTVVLLRSAVKQRSRSSAQRPRRPSLATKRRLLQSSAEEDARTIPQLQLHPRLGTKKRLGAKRSRSSARRQRRPSLATKRRLLQSSAETDARGRSHQRWRLQQNCSGMLD